MCRHNRQLCHCAVCAPEAEEAYRRGTVTQAACCNHCGVQYGGKYGFPDLVVPNDVWAKISPTGDEGGLLCPNCMVRRAVDAGLSNVPARFTSGPFAHSLGADPLINQLLATIQRVQNEAVAAQLRDERAAVLRERRAFAAGVEYVEERARVWLGKDPDRIAEARYPDAPTPSLSPRSPDGDR